MSTTTVQHTWNEGSGAHIANVGTAEVVTPCDVNSKFTRDKYEPVKVSVDDYRTLNKDGLLKISGLLSQEEIGEISRHMDDVLNGRETIPSFPEIDQSKAEEERLASFSRIHNAHRVHALHERFLLHPRILDVVEQLIGPDVLALQSMTFFKQPGQPGQGYHQDSYYIPTLPITLIAAWVAVSEATEDNGCLLFTPGSQMEPIYPQAENQYTHTSRTVEGVFDNTTASVHDTSINQLAAVAKKYPPEVVCTAKPGDVIFFRGNIFHRSHANTSSTSRRAFVTHYCDARSFVPWNLGETWEGMQDGKPANGYHILARGDTHLPFAKPKFGTPCAAIEERKPRIVGSAVAMPMADNGAIGMGDLDVTQRDDH